MSKGRLEAFSDGVVAILITIMVLELRAPVSAEAGALLPLWPIFLSYLLSYVYLGIYWSNHHHLLQAVHIVDGRVLWANLHLLLWLSLTPFVTAWMGENHFAPIPVALYGVVQLGAGIAYFILTRVLITRHGKDSVLGKAIGRDNKGIISILLYATAMAAACRRPGFACFIYVLVAVMWLIPDRRIERALSA